MIKGLKKIAFIALGILAVINIIFFVHSIALGSEINTFEKEIKSIHQENLTLENKIYQVDSLQYAASVAAQLDFTRQSIPIYIHNDVYALNR